MEERTIKLADVATFDADALQRLRRYLIGLRIFSLKGKTMVSIESIAEQQGVDASAVFSDLQQAGAGDGVRAIFDVNPLIHHLEEVLGFFRVDEACIVGCGRLANAIITNQLFLKCGIKLVAAFDVKPTLINNELLGVKVIEMDRFGSMVQRMHVVMGIIATPSEQVEAVAQHMIDSGIRIIWNFSVKPFYVPEGIAYRQSLLTDDLQEAYTDLVNQYQAISPVMS